MATKIVMFSLCFEIEDKGQFDENTMRDGITDGVLASLSNGGLTTLDDSTTTIANFNIQHTSTI